jgi:hypothetical protein
MPPDAPPKARLPGRSNAASSAPSPERSTACSNRRPDQQRRSTKRLDSHRSILLIGLGIAAAEAGYRVRYVTAAALVNELVEAADDKHLSRTIARYGRVDLLCLDELGYLQLDRRGAELLFQVFTEREERASIAVASNSAFSEWARTFTDPRLCAAIVDRITFEAHIIETGAESYRLRTTQRRRAKPQASTRTREGTSS